MARAPIRLNRSSVLWLLATLMLVVAPHMARQPVWVSAFFLLVWFWRGYLAWYGMPRPALGIILVLAAAGTSGVFITYGTIFGREPGISLVVLMLTLKLLEMRSVRDAMVAIFIGFFVVLTNFLYSQTLFMGLYMLGVVAAFVAALIAFNGGERNFSPPEMLKQAGTLLAQAAPLMLVFFLLFPRVNGPLWGMPKDSQVAKMGLSEEMSPGSIGDLALSDAVAFRAEFKTGIPPMRQLYWRGLVLDEFDGHTWRAAEIRQGALRASALQTAGTPSEYRITLEPHNRRWLFVLEMPSQIPETAKLAPAYQLRSAQPIEARMRYDAVSYLQYRAGVDAAASELAANLKLPAGNPHTLEMAQELRRNAGGAQAVAQQVLAFIREQPFRYTLSPPLLTTDNPVDEFLFTTRSGFCEHYSSAFVLLMRAAGIPARVVTGYQGGEINPVGNYLIVRQSDAHAWAEIWLQGGGWTRVDPTAAVAPERIEKGSQSAAPEMGFIGGLIGSEQLGLLRHLHLNWDALNNQWNQWVLGYNVERQKLVLSRLGMPDVSWQNMTMALFWSSAILVTAIALLMLYTRGKRHKDSALVAYRVFCAKLAKRGINREPSEGPLDFASRATVALPELSDKIAVIVSLYANTRYGVPTSSELRQLRNLVAEFAA
jgi:transglutaminase-like putative cysteine protease